MPMMTAISYRILAPNIKNGFVAIKYFYSDSGDGSEPLILEKKCKHLLKTTCFSALSDDPVQALV